MALHPEQVGRSSYRTKRHLFIHCDWNWHSSHDMPTRRSYHLDARLASIMAGMPLPKLERFIPLFFSSQLVYEWGKMWHNEVAPILGSWGFLTLCTTSSVLLGKCTHVMQVLCFKNVRIYQPGLTDTCLWKFGSVKKGQACMWMAEFEKQKTLH